ncbi:hypothetical protein [Promicromonospora soli]
MATGYEESFAIRFLTDERIYEPTGRRVGEFIAVFGELRSGPRFRTGLVIRFDARLVRPDGEVDYARAQLDYPADSDLVEETEFMVLLFGLSRADVQPGTLISSVNAVALD